MRRRNKVALFLAADLVIGAVLWHVYSKSGDSPQQAVTKVATLARNGDWSGVYDHLCDSDRHQYTGAEIQTGGTGALQLLHGLAGVHVTATQATSVHVIGPLALPAEQVSGQLVPPLGTPVDFRVTTVRQLNGWRLCLSVGGYAVPSLGIDVPLG